MLAGLHYFGACLLLAATALLLVTTITAPVIDHLALLEVRLRGTTVGSSVNFGTFGWCVIDGNSNGGNACSRSMLGYTPSNVMSSIDSTHFSNYAEDSTRALTKVMILHPIACGICFIGTVLAFGSGLFGSLLASAMGLLAFIVTLVALICDFILFSIIRRHVNQEDGAGNHASYAVGIWTLVAAAGCAFIASVVLFLTCCFGRSRRRRDSKVGLETPRPWYRR